MQNIMNNTIGNSIPTYDFPAFSMPNITAMIVYMTNLVNEPIAPWIDRTVTAVYKNGNDIKNYMGSQWSNQTARLSAATVNWTYANAHEWSSGNMLAAKRWSGETLSTVQDWSTEKLMTAHQWTVENQDTVAWTLMITALLMAVLLIYVMRRIATWNRRTTVVHHGSRMLRKKYAALMKKDEKSEEMLKKLRQTCRRLAKKLAEKREESANNEDKLVILRGESAKFKERWLKAKAKNKELNNQINSDLYDRSEMEEKLSEIQAILLDPLYTDEDDLVYNSGPWSRSKLRVRAAELTDHDIQPEKWKCRSNLAAYVRALEQLSIVGDILANREYEQPGACDDDPDWSPGDE
jgi:hypothetical protein